MIRRAWAVVRHKTGSGKTIEPATSAERDALKEDYQNIHAPRYAELIELRKQVACSVKCRVGFRDGKPAVFFTDETNEARFERIKLNPVLILPAT